MFETAAEIVYEGGPAYYKTLFSIIDQGLLSVRKALYVIYAMDKRAIQKAI